MDSIPTQEAAEGTGGGRWKRIVAGLVVVAVVALLLWGGQQAGPYAEEFGRWVESLGAWGPVAFTLGYAAATVAFVPGSILSLLGGAIFGLLWGTVYVIVGATLGASVAFLIARYLARGWVEGKIEGKPRFEQIDRAVGRDGGKIVALLRLSPVFPFNLLNYALGLTKVRFAPYVAACLAMLPGTFLYVYYGKLAGDVAAAATGTAEETVWDWVLRGIGLAATIAVTWILTSKARRVLASETEVEVDDE